MISFAVFSIASCELQGENAKGHSSFHPGWRLQFVEELEVAHCGLLEKLFIIARHTRDTREWRF